MKQKPKRGTGLYAYLDSVGVLSNGTGEEIEKAKKLYWIKYRKEWKKNKRQQSKVYMLLFSFTEARIIKQRADQRCITPVRFIKQSALLDHSSIGPVLIGRIREQLVLYSNCIETFAEDGLISEAAKDKVLFEALRMEEVLLETLKST